MDTATAEAIDALRIDLRAVESSLRRDNVAGRGEMAEMRSELAEVRADIAEIRDDIVEIRGDIVEIRGEIAEIRGEMTGMRTELKQHTQVLFESLRDDIRLIAEGLTVLTTKVDWFLPPGRAQ